MTALTVKEVSEERRVSFSIFNPAIGDVDHHDHADNAYDDNADKNDRADNHDNNDDHHDHDDADDDNAAHDCHDDAIMTMLIMTTTMNLMLMIML